MLTANTGTITYRTKALDLSTAKSFANCVAHNHSFTGVQLLPARSKTPKWYVAFQPVSEARQQAMFDKLQAAREQRAATQEFIFWQDNGIWKCYSIESGSIYSLRGRTCDCGDFTFRCAPCGMRCKHLVALENDQKNGPNIAG